MNNKKYFQHYFVYYVLPIIIFTLGLFGNIIGFIVLIKRKKLLSNGTRKMYIYLFIIDTIYLIGLLIDYIEISLGYTLSAYSNLTCKLSTFLKYSLANISPMILVYISIERYIDIKYPIQRFILQKNKIQIIYLLIIICLNIVYYMPFSLFINQNNNHNNNEIITCGFNDTLSHFDSILSYFDMFNRVLMPFILMLLSSILLVSTIYKSRKRVIQNYNKMDNKIFKKDLKLAFTSLILNFFYVLLNLPISINDIINFNDPAYFLSLYSFYASYSDNFYLLLFSNFIFRQEFYNLFKNSEYITTTNNNNNNNNNTYIYKFKTNFKNSSKAIELINF